MAGSAESAKKASVLWRWLIRVSFLFVLAGLVLLVVGAALYFPYQRVLCTVVRNTGVLLARDGYFFGILDATAPEARPAVQTVSVLSTDNITEASEGLALFSVNSSFFCLVAADGELSVPEGGKRSAALAVFIIGVAMAASFLLLAAGTLAYALISLREGEPSVRKRCKMWKDWWWMGWEHSDSEGEEQQQQGREMENRPSENRQQQNKQDDFDL